MMAELTSGAKVRDRLAQAHRIAHLTLQPSELDARVHRAVSTLRAAGREIVLVAPGRGYRQGPMTFRRKLAAGLAFGSGARLGLLGARAAFWSFADHRAALRALIATRPDAIHAHDWDGLVIGAQAARVLDVPLVYDAHEFASEMHRERRFWRWTMIPAIARLEADAIRTADAVIVVSPGLAKVMRESHRLDRPPFLVRNIPDVAPVPYIARPKRDRILVHYHGILAEGRGLVPLVEAMALAPPRFGLRLTGPWRQARFKRTLTETIARLGIAERVEIVPPVPFYELVAHASDADVGVSLLLADSRHNRHSLPNKVFEYLHAGLCLLSPAHSADIAGLIRQHACGVTLPDTSPETIAAALEQMDRSFIDERRSAARAAAEELCWPNEARRLLAIYGIDLDADSPVGK